MILALSIGLLVLLYTFQSLFTKLYSMNYTGPATGHATAVFSICWGGFIGIVTLLMNGCVFTPSWQTVLWGLANAAMLWLYNTSLIQAGDRGSYAFVMVCMLFGGIIVPMLFGIAFLGESLTLLQAAAIVLMLISFVIMNARGISFKGASGKYYMWCAIVFVANGLYGTIMNAQQKLTGGMENSEMIVVAYAGSALVVGLVYLLRGKLGELGAAFRMGRKAALCALGSCLVATFASNLLMALLGQMDSSILYTIDNGGVLVLSALFSCLIFREKLRWEQWLGIGVATLSIVMISL